MKKSKILMPILAASGVAVTLTPLICLTSCGIKTSVTHDCFTKCKLVKEKNGNITITATLKDDFNDVNLGESKVNVERDNGSGSHTTFQDLIDANQLDYNKEGKSVTIVLDASFIKKEGETSPIKQLTFDIYGKE